jgi:hypothetical protein
MRHQTVIVTYNGSAIHAERVEIPDLQQSFLEDTEVNAFA